MGTASPGLSDHREVLFSTHIAASPQLELRLLGRFELRSANRSVPVGWNGQRLLAHLALRAGAAAREDLARALWPDVAPHRLHSTLRSVLWRLRRSCSMVVDSSTNQLRLADRVAVDVLLSTEVARQLLNYSVPPSPEQLGVAMRTNFREDLLPTWVDEDWLAADRERFRQLRLHSLDLLCERLTAAGWHGAAIDAGLASVSADPFRESARSVLIKAYMAERNFQLAAAELGRYRKLLHDELGCEPSRNLCQLIAGGHDLPLGA
jgi:DNA-binding SARP family transcriptional activator